MGCVVERWDAMSVNDGGPAFPVSWQEQPGGQLLAVPGMSLHDYYVGQAIGQFEFDSETLGRILNGETPRYSAIVEFCRGLADAAIKARVPKK